MKNWRLMAASLVLRARVLMPVVPAVLGLLIIFGFLAGQSWPASASPWGQYPVQPTATAVAATPTAPSAQPPPYPVVPTATPAPAVPSSPTPEPQPPTATPVTQPSTATPGPATPPAATPTRAAPPPATPAQQPTAAPAPATATPPTPTTTPAAAATPSLTAVRPTGTPAGSPAPPIAPPPVPGPSDSSVAEEESIFVSVLRTALTGVGYLWAACGTLAFLATIAGLVYLFRGKGPRSDGRD